jgi:hypothetical protein
MRKTATTVAGDPVQARIQVLERVKARRPEDKVRQYPNLTGGPAFVYRNPPDTDRLPPRDLEQWADDRELACFAGRVRLNAAEQVAQDILTVMRSGDTDAVRRAVSDAGKGLDGQVRFLVAALLETWRGSAPVFAMDVTIAALGEARRLQWDRSPRRQQRGPSPLSQLPGKAA